MSNAFSGKKLINSMCQVPNSERLLCKSKFMPVENFDVNSCGKHCVRCLYLLNPLLTYSKEWIKLVKLAVS